MKLCTVLVSGTNNRAKIGISSFQFNGITFNLNSNSLMTLQKNLDRSTATTTSVSCTTISMPSQFNPESRRQSSPRIQNSKIKLATEVDSVVQMLTRLIRSTSVKVRLAESLVK